MRVALDVAGTRLAQAGVTRVITSLAGALRARSDVVLTEVGGGHAPPPGSWSRRALALRLDLAWHPYLGRRAARAAGAQLYHCPSPRAPLIGGDLPVVVSVHDLAALLHPRTMSRWNGLYTRATLRRVLDRADRITAVSSDTANDLDRLLGVGGARVRVVPNGVDSSFFGAPAGSPLVEGDYALFVGTPEPRKNLLRLSRAMELLHARGRREALVIAGSAGWGGVRLASPDSVVALGRVGDDELRSLYAHARCLVLPSLHEGFGLPVLEAMAAGCPVVAAASGALPEVCAGAAVMVDPLSVRSIAAGIETALAERTCLRDAGLARVRDCGWDRSAAALSAVYHELA